MTERAQPTEEQLRERLSQANQLQVNGRYREARQAYGYIIDNIENDGPESILLIDAFNGRGVMHRMLNDYHAAEADFFKAKGLTPSFPYTFSLGQYLEGQLTAYAGLIDLYRTGDKDPRFGKCLIQAERFRRNARIILEAMQPEWHLAKVDAYINFGLLDLEFYNHETALQNYLKAEKGARELLEQKPDEPVVRNRLARVLTVKGVVLEKLDRLNESAEVQGEALFLYRELSDVRGIVNGGRSLCQVFIRMGHLDLAKLSLEVALEATTDENGQIIDPTSHVLVIQELAELGSKESPK